MAAESRLQRWILKTLRKLGCYAVIISPPVEVGTPDILVCIKGKFIGIEVKVGKNKPTRIQEHRMGQIREAGGTTVVIYSREELWKFLYLHGLEKPSAGKTP